MKLLALFAALALVAVCNAHEKTVFCYYGTWSTYRNGDGKFDVSNIDPFLCTHLGYSFFGIDTQGNMKSLDDYLDYEENWGRGNIKAFNDLKNVNPKLKTLAVVGGWNEGSLKYSEVAADPAKRQNFIRSSVEFIQKHGFDGLDLDWEYPAQRDSTNHADKANFVTWLQEIRAEYDKHGYLITIAVGATANLAEPSYNIPAISKALHFINLMTYDLHGSWDGRTGENAPLYDSGDLSVNAAVNYWLQQGAPAEKLVLGLGFYGRSFTLANSGSHGLGAPTTGPGAAGPFTGEPGLLGYNEICANKNWNIVWNEDQVVPFGYQSNQWVGFDNPRSIQDKVVYSLERDLGGVMVWSIETDDFRGACGPKYPLLHTIDNVLNGDTSIPIPEPQPENPEPENPGQPETPVDPTGSDCEGKSNGYYRDVNDCSKFFQCVNGLQYDFQCPQGLDFDTTTSTCNFHGSVQC
ncbi:CHIA.2 family protein [Megaselia abdita]